MKRRTRVAISVVLSAAILAAALAVAIEATGAPPRLLGPHLERRSQGHNAVIETIGRAARQSLLHLDRGHVHPRLALPAWADAAAAIGATTIAASGFRGIAVGDEASLQRALAEAQPGDVITLAPGRYRFTGRALTVTRAGAPGAPVTLRAPQRDAVELEFAMTEGFHVLAPHWVFENLSIRGACDSHDACEHAFHVVGGATDVVIRNNVLRDFNAHIKINGQGGRFPDRGRISRNTLINGSPRATDSPVTPIDLVAAADWLIDANLIADFVKQGGDQTSYGAFAKGAARGTRFERNVVLCEHRLRGAAGRRVGLSFGGGGSSAAACRDSRCEHEHAEGTMVNNLIASCSDEGIYVNRSSGTRIEFNTLVDTAGISVRFPESDARLSGNLVDGRIQERDGGRNVEEQNRTTELALLYLGIHPVRGLFADADELDLRWTREPPRMPRHAYAPPIDLCGMPRPVSPAYGAFESIESCRR